MGRGLGFSAPEIEEILETNLKAPVGLIEAFAPQMVARGGGRIVNVGSVAAFTGHPDLWYCLTWPFLYALRMSQHRAELPNTADVALLCDTGTVRARRRS